MKYIQIAFSALFSVGCSTHIPVTNNVVPVSDAVLDVQIQADKEHNSFISREATMRSLDLELFKIPLIDKPGLPLLYKYVKYNDSKEEALNWSKAIAKHRYAKDEHERMELVYALLKSASAKSDFKESTELLNCKKGLLVISPMAEDPVVLSFYPAFPIKEKLWAIIETTDAGNEQIKYFQLKVKQEAKNLNRKSIPAVLIATTKQSRKIQSCNLQMELTN